MEEVVSELSWGGGGGGRCGVSRVEERHSWSRASREKQARAGRGGGQGCRGTASLVSISVCWLRK